MAVPGRIVFKGGKIKLMNKRRIASRTILGLCTLWGFFVINLAATGEATVNESIQQKYRFAEPETLEVKVFEHSFKRIKMPGLTNYWREGEPLIPVKVARILLPYGKEADKVIVIPGEKVVLEGKYSIEPGQRPVPLDQGFKPEYVPPKAEIYDSTNPFPAGNFFQVQTVITRGYRILIVSLSPVSYIPKTGILSYYKELILTIETKPQVKSPRTFRGLASDAEAIRNNVDNSEMLATYPVK